MDPGGIDMAVVGALVILGLYRVFTPGRARF
jgi:hypothetical protein